MGFSGGYCYTKNRVDFGEMESKVRIMKNKILKKGRFVVDFRAIGIYKTWKKKKESIFGGNLESYLEDYENRFQCK